MHVAHWICFVSSDPLLLKFFVLHGFVAWARFVRPPPAHANYLQHTVPHPLHPTTPLSPHTSVLSEITFNIPGRPPRKRIEVEEGTTPAALSKGGKASSTPKSQAPSAGSSAAAAPSARAQAAVSTSRAASGGGSSSSNTKDSRRGRLEKAVKKPDPEVRSRQVQRQHVRTTDGRTHDDKADGSGGNGRAKAEGRVKTEGRGVKTEGRVKAEGRGKDEGGHEMRRGDGGRSPWKQSKKGRPYAGKGGDSAKRPGRSTSSARSDDSLVEGQAPASWNPLTPPDRRLRAAGPSPGCVFYESHV